MYSTILNLPALSMIDHFSKVTLLHCEHDEMNCKVVETVPLTLYILMFSIQDVPTRKPANQRLFNTSSGNTAENYAFQGIGDDDLWSADFVQNKTLSSQWKSTFKEYR